MRNDKKITFLIFIIFLTFINIVVFSGVNTNVSRITVTQAIVNKYINTLPGYAKKSKEIGQRYSVEGSATQSDAVQSNNILNNYLKSSGWANPRDFYAVNIKICVAYGWVGIIASEIPEAQKQQALAQFDPVLDSYGITASEKAVIKNNAKRLKALFEQISEDN